MPDLRELELPPKGAAPINRNALLLGLPDELLLLIVGYLRTTDALHSLAFVCARLASVVNDGVVWHELIAARWPGVRALRLDAGLCHDLGPHKTLHYLEHHQPRLPASFAAPSDLTVQADGRTVTFDSNRFGKAGAIQPNGAIPLLASTFYFEITVVDDGPDCNIGIGLCTAGSSHERMVGWDSSGVGYHGDDGKKRRQPVGEAYGPKWQRGDTVGCGWHRATGECFFTLNGQQLGTAYVFESTDKQVFPVVTCVYLNRAVQRAAYTIATNYGERPFCYQGALPTNAANRLALAATMSFRRLACGGSFGRPGTPVTPMTKIGSSSSLRLSTSSLCPPSPSPSRSPSTMAVPAVSSSISSGAPRKSSSSFGSNACVSSSPLASPRGSPSPSPSSSFGSSCSKRDALFQLIGLRLSSRSMTM